MRPEELDQLCARLCQRLVAHDLYLDAPALTLLGSGDLGVDLRFGHCRFDDRFIPPLLLVSRLRNELRATLSADDPNNPIRHAEIRIGLEMVAQQGSRNGKMTWLGAGQDFIGCTIDAEAQIIGDTASGRATVHSVVDWPLECAKWILPPLRSRQSRRISKWFRVS